MDFHFVILLPVIMVIAWQVTLVANARYHQLHDRLLMAFLACGGLTMYTTHRALVEGSRDYGFIILDNLESVVALSIVPLQFLYIRTVAFDTKWRKWYWWLFVPSAVIGTIGTALSTAVGWDRILEATGYSNAPFTPQEGNTIEWLYRFVNITLFNLTFEIMAIVLIGLCVWYLRKFRKQVENYYSNLEDSSVNKMRIFLLSSVLLLATMFSTACFIGEIVDCWEKVLEGLSLWYTFLLMVMADNAYRIRLTRQQMEVLELEADTRLDTDNDPSETTANVLAQKIEQWENRADEPFCQEGLTLVELAREIGVNRQVLSAYINKHKGTNFNLWINGLRVEKAKHILQTEPDVKIGYVSDICGFSTQQAFSRAFRQIAGCSPHEFRNT